MSGLRLLLLALGALAAATATHDDATFVIDASTKLRDVFKVLAALLSHSFPHTYALTHSLTPMP